MNWNIANNTLKDAIWRKALGLPAATGASLPSTLRRLTDLKLQGAVYAAFICAAYLFAVIMVSLSLNDPLADIGLVVIRELSPRS